MKIQIDPDIWIDLTPKLSDDLINYSCQDLSRCRGRHQAPRGEGEGPRACRPHWAGAAAEE